MHELNAVQHEVEQELHERFMELSLEAKKWEYKVRDAEQELIDVVDKRD